MGGTIVEGDPLLPSGAPNVRSMLFRASETRVIDTWDTSGLRGTGSHDFEAKDVFVEESRSFALITDTPRAASPIFTLPFWGVLAAGVSAVALGIARAAVDAAVALAKSKQPMGAKRSIAQRELVQLDVARAESKVRAARAFLFEAAREAEAADRGSLKPRAILRLAATHAATESAAAVDLAYNVGGASSIYAKNPLQRHFRDVHVATQHLMVQKTIATTAGRVLLDLETDTSTL
jgi:alkylation response protein AidB-like acyl-CoA dehydrogenase